MRALKFDGKQVVLDARVADPEPAPGEALIRTTRLAISPVDLAVARGVTNFRGILGREFVGLVEKVHAAPGRLDQEKWVGRRVISQSSVPCGQCERCRAGLSLHCPTRTVPGLFGREGCLCDRVVLPLTALVEVPKTLGDEEAVLAQCVADALHAANMVRVEGKTFVTVIGDSLDALLTAQAMARKNATVRLIGRDERRLAICEKWGIKHRPLEEVGLRQDQAIVVDCSDTDEGAEMALRLVRARGTVILKSPFGIVPEQAWSDASSRSWTTLRSSHIVAHELTVMGARSGSVSDALEPLASKAIDLLNVVTRRFRLSDGVAALKAAADPGQVKVVIEP